MCQSRFTLRCLNKSQSMTGIFVNLYRTHVYRRQEKNPMTEQGNDDSCT